MSSHDLGATIRAWRDRTDPAQVGIDRTRRRRVPGLRRQELATLAGLSVEYLARLEQGRAAHPSAAVLAPLARALRLTDEERDHLFRLAGHAAPVPGAASRHVTPLLQRIVDRLPGAAVTVFDVEWNMMLANPLAVALLGPHATDPGPDGNAVRRQFLGAPTRFVSAPEDDRAFETAVVADLRWASSRYPADRGLAELIAEMRRTSDRFDRLWERGVVAPFVSSAKTIRHPEVGDIRVACDVLADVRTALRMTVYSAEPDTPDDRALALLAAVGTQDLAR